MLLAGAIMASSLVAMPLALAAAPAQAADVVGDSGPAVVHDVSPALSSLAGAADTADVKDGPKEHRDKHHAALPPKPKDPRKDDGALQKVAGSGVATAVAAPAATSFEGLGAGLSGFTVQYAPPDTDAAVGPTQIVQVVNSGFAVFGKTGGVLYGPAATNTLFLGMSGACATTNDGDGTVRYDRQADRWIIAQFANTSSSTGPWDECVAVSTTGDATGRYYRYDYQYSNFPDYPKLGVWPDAYYVTYNLFRGNTFAGAEVCALDRAKMLTGADAAQQCTTLSTAYAGLLPVDNAGSQDPPTGEAALFVALGTRASTLDTWHFHVDWQTSLSSRFTGPLTISTDSYNIACNGGACIPQPSTSNRLDSLGDRVMYHLSYRNNGGTESVVLTHSVTANTSTGIRWYELRNPAGGPTVYQQGTYAPDAAYRWMGSAAMDKNGGIALGYSTSSGSSYPSIRYTGRGASDALGTMTAGEGVIQAGGGSQTGTLQRWGDYASMSIDPADDCTFWFASEYLASSGRFNWHTRIGRFALPSCTVPVGNDFSLSASPTTATVYQGDSAMSTLTTAVTSGSPSPVIFSASPSGATFSPTTAAVGITSTMTIPTTSTTPTGTTNVVVTAGNGSATHTATIALTVQPANDFSLSAPSAGTIEQGNSLPITVASGVLHGTAEAIALTSSPSAIPVTFTPSAVTAGATATATISPSLSTAPGTYQLALTGTSPSVAHSVPFTLTVTAAPGSSPVVNGGFEDAVQLTGWTRAGITDASGPGRTGSLSARGGLSSTPTNGVSSVSQTFTTPTWAKQVSFWWGSVCPDTVTYDWTTATLKDNSNGGTTITVIPKTCVRTFTWAQVSSSLIPGHSYTLTLTNRDDNYTGDATYSRFDDVTLS